MKEPRSLLALAGGIVRELPRAARRAVANRAFMIARGVAARAGLDLRSEAEAERARDIARMQNETYRVLVAQLDMERARGDFATQKLAAVMNFLNPNKKAEPRA